MENEKRKHELTEEQLAKISGGYWEEPEYKDWVCLTGTGKCDPPICRNCGALKRTLQDDSIGDIFCACRKTGSFFLVFKDGEIW